MSDFDDRMDVAPRATSGIGPAAQPFDGMVGPDRQGAVFRFGRAAVSRMAAAKPHATTASATFGEGTEYVEGDALVLACETSKDDGHPNIVDVEAEKAKDTLRRKITNTERAIRCGFELALVRQLGADARSLDEEAQEMALGHMNEPLKDTLGEWINGGLKNARLGGGAALGRGVRGMLANEATAMVGKVAGAVAVVGAAKEVAGAIEEAEVADFTANTFGVLFQEISARLPRMFDHYVKIVDRMEAQPAVDAASEESTAPWIEAEDVAREIKLLVDNALIQSGALKGTDRVDKVQELLNSKKEL